MRTNWKYFITSLMLLVILLINGCSSGTEFAKDDGQYMATEEAAVDYDDASGRSGLSNSSAEIPKAQSFNSTERMMIYNANLSIEVKDYHKVEAEIQEKVNNTGGYIVESNIYFSGEDRISGNLVVKVPQQNFHSFINEVESNSIKVNERRVHGNDVTEEYIDLESRLKSKRVVEERLLGFMKEAERTEDLLKISSDLSRVQEEIEQTHGRMNYLETNVNYSTVTIHMSENLVNVATIQDSEALNTWGKARGLFIDSINGVISFFSNVTIFLIGRSPIIVPVVLVALLIAYFVRKKGNAQPPYEG